MLIVESFLKDKNIKLNNNDLFQKKVDEATSERCDLCVHEVLIKNNRLLISLTKKDLNEMYNQAIKDGNISSDPSDDEFQDFVNNLLIGMSLYFMKYIVGSEELEGEMGAYFFESPKLIQNKLRYFKEKDRNLVQEFSFKTS